jgi:hypothetical protein
MAALCLAEDNQGASAWDSDNSQQDPDFEVPHGDEEDGSDESDFCDDTGHIFDRLF